MNRHQNYLGNCGNLLDWRVPDIDTKKENLAGDSRPKYLVCLHFAYCYSLYRNGEWNFRRTGLADLSDDFNCSDYFCLDFLKTKSSRSLRKVYGFFLQVTHQIS